MRRDREAARRRTSAAVTIQSFRRGYVARLLVVAEKLTLETNRARKHAEGNRRTSANLSVTSLFSASLFRDMPERRSSSLAMLASHGTGNARLGALQARQQRMISEDKGQHGAEDSAYGSRQKWARREAAARKIQQLWRAKVAQRKFCWSQQTSLGPESGHSAQLLDAIACKRGELAEQRRLQSQQSHQLARLRLLVILGQGGQRCHQCDLGVVKLHVVLRTAGRVCSEVHEQLRALGSAQDLLSNITSSLALVADLDQRLGALGKHLFAQLHRPEPVSTYQLPDFCCYKGMFSEARHREESTGSS